MKTDKNYIYKELLKIYKNYPKYNILNFVPYPSNKSCSIGYDLPHIKESNYAKIFEEETRAERFCAQFMDDGLMYLYYEFDNSGRLISHSLQYLPNPYLDETSDLFSLYKSYNLNDILSKYLRIDYDTEAYKPIYHGKVHLHIGLNRNGIRLPFDSWISPIRFLRFVSAYVYRTQLKITSTTSAEMLLTPEEMQEEFISHK